ncbi:MAG: hypothetical protein U9R08_03370 [Nanoarchaeota archaeon]|nr:hypothetical protein [Nanoarchaeota archaeon]
MNNSSNNYKLAELLGIILGDGNLHKSEYRITIVGSLEDYSYYENRVLPLFSKIFNKSLKIKFRNDRNAIYIELNNKIAVKFLLKLGLKQGNKLGVGVPNLILKNDCLIPHFLRGLFDTDGSLKFQKQSKLVNHYPRIQFCFKHSPLSIKLKDLIISLGFNFSSWIDKRGLHYYHISGSKNLDKWMQLVNMNNPVHKTKYLYWKQKGFCIPKSTLEQRKKALNL